MKPARLWRLFFFPAFFGACASPPSPLPAVIEENPVSRLDFDRVQAVSIHDVSLFFTLTLSNPRSVPFRTGLKGWKAELDGNVPETGAALLHVEDALVLPGEDAEIPVRLDLDLSKCPPSEAAGLAARLTISIGYLFLEGAQGAGTVSAVTVFDRIREPVFTITSIAVLQAELVNTRFRVSLRIDNPNFFPVDLSSFGYELYGEGRFWAGGEERDVLHIPARGSGERMLFLLMNFINMKRSLLDEVIAMNMVRYRFRGEVEVGTGVEYLPRFDMVFDHSGLSEVFK
jgi:LEA14-like dessication related protein